MKKNILIMRQKKQAKPLADFLEREGFEVFVEPLFSVKKFAVRKIQTNIFVSAAIITSANACDGILKSGLTKDTKIFCVGKKTAEKLLQNGFKNVVTPKKETAVSLCDLIAKNHRDRSGNILYFQGQITSFDFKKELKKSGFKVENILSYKMIEKSDFSLQLRNFVEKNSFNYILIFSQNSAKAFLKLARKHNMLEYFRLSKILCLSEKILLEVKKSGFKNSATFNQFPILKSFYG